MSENETIASQPVMEERGLVIAPPRERVPLPLLAALGVVLSTGLFLELNAHRISATVGGGRMPGTPVMNMVAAPPPLAIPAQEEPWTRSTLSRMPAISLIDSRAPRMMAPPPVSLPPPTLSDFSHPPAIPVADIPYIPSTSQAEGSTVSAAPGLVIDQSTGTGGQTGSSAAAGVIHEGGGDDDAAHASWIRNRVAVIPQGAIIAAVLETPLNSDRPGLVRAIVSKDARGFDGTRILIPRGSRLVGEFKADTTAGLRRVLVNWTRLIRPDGVAIRIGSPASDPLGGAGIAGSVNTHFMERFGSAVLQSALSIGTSLATTLPVDSSRSLYLGVPGQMAQVGQQLIPSNQRPATVKVKEGAQVAILVARDLDFSGTPAIR